ncbi:MULTISPECIES: TetR/AcrR family transcriptional regulator [unclassified Luteococcus]|uniref:TetR/AcrR family transcriptional regulator n=1 Tax=unclassified Luteococcus TaxID=2639923 RepID=UPI00313BE415
MPRIGRRPGQGDTREVILAAARELFAERDFSKVSVRAIAAAAGVDPAMINHWFGSKEGLFQEALEIPAEVPARIAELLSEADDERLPERLVRTFLRVWEGAETGAAMQAMLRRAMAGEMPLEALEEFVRHAIVTPVATRLGVPAEEAQHRFGLVASQLLGMLVVRQLLRLEPLASVDHEVLVATYTPVVRHYLFEDLPEGDPA